MNPEMILIDADRNHLFEILNLNTDLVHFLSPLDLNALQKLGEMSEMFKVVQIDGKVEAFLIALREGQSYDSLNYRWFAERFDQFIYIDRVVVSEKCHRMGIGKLIYHDVLRHAAATGIPRITAEIDILPENPVSLKFHAAFGFEEVGRQYVCDGKKQVSLQVVEVK